MAAARVPDNSVGCNWANWALWRAQTHMAAMGSGRHWRQLFLAQV